MEYAVSASKRMISYCVVAALLSTFSLISWAQQGQAPHIDSNEIQRIQKKSASLSAKERAETREFFKAAFAAYQAGRFEEAEVLFGKGLQIDQANVDAQFFFGMVLRERKKTADAIKAFSFAAALGPNTVNGTRAALAAKSLFVPPPGTVFRDCTDCPEMVVIPEGSYDMGSNGNDDEKPLHRVSVSAFALAWTEVTQAQWRAIMGSNPSKFSGCGDHCPVENVSWNDAQEYVNKLSQKTGKTYRLPSEAEWEYACRAGGHHEYCGSESIDSVAWYGDNSSGRTHFVAGKQANAFGLSDISGNVWEWVEDCWHDNYGGAPSDGSAWTAGQCNARVLRGGSWNGLPQYARSAARFWNSATIRDAYIGFRPARRLP